jgi:hypothetical protein
MRPVCRRHDKLFMALLAGMTFSIEANAQLTTLYTFNASLNERISVDPIGVLVSDPAGNLYGTGSNGVAAFPCGSFIECGEVFKLARSAGGTYAYSQLYVFQGGGDGGHPRGGVVLDPAGSGNLFGTSFDGGVTGSSACGAAGCGTAFTLNSSGTMIWKYQFVGGSDGANPHASLVLDSQGNLFGTTSAGGGGSCTSLSPPDPGPGDPGVGGFGYPRVNGCGTVFKLTSTGGGTFQETVLYTFKGGTDGANPYSNLLFDASGSLYGTTAGGGSTGCGGAGCGTVFKLTPSGSTFTETVLYAFTGGADGAFPYAGLITDASGNFYGTTANGGGTGCGGGGCGTVFKLTPSGSGTFTETIVHAFTGGTDGANPYGSLVSDSIGNLYGATRTGGGGTCRGGFGCGTLFFISFTGTEFVLHAFTGPTDGASPYAGLYFDGFSAFFGTTQYGGNGTNCTPLEYEPSGCGTVFQLGASEPTCTDSAGALVPLHTKQFVACPASSGGTQEVGTSTCPAVSSVTGPRLPDCATQSCVAQNTWSPIPPDPTNCTVPCTDPAMPNKVFIPGDTETGTCPVGGETGTTTRTCNAGGVWGAWDTSACHCPTGQVLCFNTLKAVQQCVTPPGISPPWCGFTGVFDCSNVCATTTACAPKHCEATHLQSLDLFCGDGVLPGCPRTGGGSDVALVTFLALMAVWSAAGIWHGRKTASR